MKDNLKKAKWDLEKEKALKMLSSIKKDQRKGIEWVFISWRDRVENEEVLNRMETKLHFMEDIIKRKMKYAGHIMRESSSLSHQ